MITHEQCSGVHPNSDVLGFGQDHDWSLGFSGDSIFLNEKQLSKSSKMYTICTLPVQRGLLPFEYLIPVGESPYSKMKVTQFGKGFPDDGYPMTEKDNEVPIHGVLMCQIMITNFDYFTQKQIADERFKDFKDLFVSSIKSSYGPKEKTVGIVSLTPRNVQVSKVGNTALQTATADILVTFYMYSSPGQNMTDFSLEISSKIIFNPTSLFGQIFEWSQLNFLTKDTSPPIEQVMNRTSCMGSYKGKTALEAIVAKYGYYSDVVTEYFPESVIGYFSFNHIIPNVPTLDDHQRFVLSFRKALSELLDINYRRVGAIAVADTPLENARLGYGVLKFYIDSNNLDISRLMVEKLALELSKPNNVFSRKMNWKQIEVGYCNKPKFYMRGRDMRDPKRPRGPSQGGANINDEENPFLASHDEYDDPSPLNNFDYSDSSEESNDALDEFINSFARHGN
ncbi:hypothetical protein OIY81_2943 [Cryptosporidium canis]|nr:hypothetical protein OIY81_2943 [Cryptosporidium canis]